MLISHLTRIKATVSVASLLMVSLYPNLFVCHTSMIREDVGAPSTSRHPRSRRTASTFARYSNNLRSSSLLTIRIAIREKSLACSGETNIRPPAGSFPSNACRSEATTGISLTDMHKAPDTLKIPPLGGLDFDEGIISESLSPSSWDYLTMLGTVPAVTDGA